MDWGHSQTDKMLVTLEKKLERSYKQAAKETDRKMKEYLGKFKKKDKEQAKKLKAGLITQDQYDKWKFGQMMTGKRWQNMRDTLAHDMNNANMIASTAINGYLPDVYALNANYGSYEAYNNGWAFDLNTSFTLYDHDTVIRLMHRDPHIIPKARVDIPKDLRWNRQKITSAMTQGILQGESIPKIARRLQGVTDMNYKAAIRNARTYTTAAENGGREDSYERLKKMGIDVDRMWLATPDSRTRDSHRAADGEIRPVGQAFSNGCMFPGDPEARPEEIYNCRCRLVAVIKGHSYNNPDRFTRLPEGMTYEQWKYGMEHKDGGGNPFVPEAYTPDRLRNAKRFDDGDEADKYHRPNLDTVWDNLTDREKYGVWEYTRNSNPMNQPLSGYNDGWSRNRFVGLGEANWGLQDNWRSVNSDDFIEKFSKDKTGNVDYYRTIKDTTLGIDKSALPDDTWLVRGSGKDGFAGLLEGNLFSYGDAEAILNSGDIDHIKAALEGQTFQNHAFTSTGVAEGTGFSGDVSYKIYAPKGTKAIYAEPASYFGGTISGEEIYKTGKEYDYVGGEAEIIIQRGTSYRIRSIEESGYGGLTVTMEVVDQPNYFKTGAENTFDDGAKIHKKY